MTQTIEEKIEFNLAKDLDKRCQPQSIAHTHKTGVRCLRSGASTSLGILLLCNAIKTCIEISKTRRIYVLNDARTTLFISLSLF